MELLSFCFVDEMNLHIDTTQRELRRVVASKQVGIILVKNERG